jgi:organic radical activating enzyme
MEHFYTLQGEGLHTGKAAYFIRLGGCDVGCVWCDVKDSWDASKHPAMSSAEIVDLAIEYRGRIAVITGGEPAMYDLSSLCDELHARNFKTHIETSGAYPLTGDLDWITLSPKKFKAPLEECLAKADELKVVVFHPSDFAWAELHAAKVKPGCLLYLQPEWSKKEIITPLIIDYIKEHPEWQLSLQTHKYINIP